MTAVDRLLADLHVVFGLRLLSLVVYGRHALEAPPPQQPMHTLALVEDLGMADLEAASRLARDWRAAGLAVPLMLSRVDFARSLDVFPLELGAIIDAHRVIYGSDPFAGLAVNDHDVRRACEVDLKGHLLHLRESYVETFGDPDAIAALVDASSAALRTLVSNVARLDGHRPSSTAELSSHLVQIIGPMHARTLGAVLALGDAPMPSTDGARLFPEYLAAVEALSSYVDSWA